MDRSFLVPIILFGMAALNPGAAIFAEKPPKIDIPKTLSSDWTPEWGTGFPDFVRADAIFDKNGNLNEVLLSPHARERITELIAESSEFGCVHFPNWVQEGTEIIETLDQFAMRGDHLFSAHVVERSPGVARIGYLAGFMYLLRPETVIHSNETLHSHYYMFYPLGKFKAGEYNFCGIDYGGQFPRLPEVGGKVFVRFHTDRGKSSYLGVDLVSGVITIGTKGHVSYPVNVQHDAAQGKGSSLPGDFPDLLELLSKKAARK